MLELFWHDAQGVACLLLPQISLILQPLKCTIALHCIKDRCIFQTCYRLPLIGVEQKQTSI
jgi:hypothetical protein